ncbi:hypothetical protein PMIN01_03960 [Paraphaeosphaeria minitans]|uniref:Uncharacterized protein n=1 Tax=Paraphaeosphaeria minitans TaxID=565426 RepID=A0A9P6GMZ3_9PLEO|nr:hypothetical protein PMIN01_03960 [Paraphaeosphaeria minitans]
MANPALKDTQARESSWLKSPNRHVRRREEKQAPPRFSSGAHRQGAPRMLFPREACLYRIGLLEDACLLPSSISSRPWHCAISSLPFQIPPPESSRCAISAIVFPRGALHSTALVANAKRLPRRPWIIMLCSIHLTIWRSNRLDKYLFLAPCFIRRRPLLVAVPAKSAVALRPRPRREPNIESWAALVAPGFDTWKPSFTGRWRERSIAVRRRSAASEASLCHAPAEKPTAPPVREYIVTRLAQDAGHNGRALAEEQVSCRDRPYRQGMDSTRALVQNSWPGAALIGAI